MTSASDLFNHRRFRFGRSTDQFCEGSNFGANPHRDRSNRHHHRHSISEGNPTPRGRVDPCVCYPFRRSHHLHHYPRQPPLHRSSHLPQEHELTRMEDGGHQFSLGNASHFGSHVNEQDRLRVGLNDRLPGAVLRARERLLQRLRGVTFSNSRDPSGTRHNDIATGDDFRLVDAGDRETEISQGWLSPIAPLTDQQTNKRPPGLTQNAMSRLCVEVFSFVEEKSNEQEGSSRTISECSICLDSFSEGDELICLPCEHRYHCCCLEPWVRTCGDCPYCRRGIDVNLHGMEEIPEC